MTTDQLASASDAISEKSRQRFNRVVVQIQKAKELVAELAADDEIGAFLMACEAIGHLQRSIEYLVYARPHSLCRFCGGNGHAKDSTCFHCKGHGWLPSGVMKNGGTGPT